MTKKYSDEELLELAKKNIESQKIKDEEDSISLPPNDTRHKIVDFKTDSEGQPVSYVSKSVNKVKSYFELNHKNEWVCSKVEFKDGQKVNIGDK
tara:strand:- start:2898 stop:3179 length:282 start_codon:yes stop_codon:yes gene_type:complete